MKRNKNQKQREKNMSQNKILLKEGVITSGSGFRRAVLDYDSGLVYQYDKPENVLAYYEGGKGWISKRKPTFYRGGWGNNSSGDSEGYYLQSNAEDLLRAIDARVFRVSSEQFLTSKEIKSLAKTAKHQARLIKQQNKIAVKLGKSLMDVDDLPKYELKRIYDGKSAKGQNVTKIASSIKNALSVFTKQKGKDLKIDDYFVSKNLVKQKEKVVAFRDLKGQVFMNSEVLQVSHFERNFMGNQSLIQANIRKVAKYSIPFNVLAAANLKLSETRVLEQGPESTHQVKLYWGAYQTQERHFTGALLLENSGRKFLMDIDREEIKHQIFNAFFVEVDRSVKTIAEAYESMKPEVVKQAEAKGLHVKRQGEWFFIPTDKTLTVLNQQIKSWENQGETEVLVRSQISHGKGRPNTLYKPKGFGALDQFVCGMVEHTGREHRPLDLGSEVDQKSENKPTTFKLWQVVGNTTVGNFTITGDVD